MFDPDRWSENVPYLTNQSKHTSKSHDDCLVACMRETKHQNKETRVLIGSNYREISLLEASDCSYIFLGVCDLHHHAFSGVVVLVFWSWVEFYIVQGPSRSKHECGA